MIPHKEIYDLAVLSLYTNGWCAPALPVAALRMLKHLVVYDINSSNGCHYLVKLTTIWLAAALLCCRGSDARGARVRACARHQKGCQLRLWYRRRRSLSIF